MNEQKIRVLIADDSALMRKVLNDLLSADPRIAIVGLARDGDDALRQVSLLSPDVVTLDIEMPKKNGLAVLEELMRIKPIPVIMVSSLTQEGAQITLKALSLGCVDFVPKPSGMGPLEVKNMGEELISKIIVAKGAKVRALPASAVRLSAAPAAAAVSQRQGRREIVAIAASTGGPMALQQLLSKLPENFPLPIVITQHMPKDFTSSFAKRLDTLSKITVVEGEDGTSLKPGCAVVAPGGSHLVVKRKSGAFCCGLSDAPPVLSVKPSANIMFSSVAEEFGGKVVCVVLTGMGKDGADGAVALRAKGAYVIAESQETCVVYGMPKAVVEAGVADEVLPLAEIPDALLRCVKGV